MEGQSEIYGLIDGIVYQQHERTDELNDRLQQRISSDTLLQPLYDPRPVSTKYATFPIVDRRVVSKVDAGSYLDYSTTGGFASMQTRGPVNGFFDKVNDESRLRNQYYALGSGSQGVFVPSSNSDLFVAPVFGPGSLTDSQPFPGLFVDEALRYEGIASPVIGGGPVGGDRFLNSTRMQLRGQGELR
jgi:hypothetical protein